MKQQADKKNALRLCAYLYIIGIVFLSAIVSSCQGDRPDDVLSRRKKAGSLGALAGFIKLVVILAVLAGIWFSGLGPKWLRWLTKKKDQTVQTVQQKAQEGVQKDSNRRKATNDFYDSVADPNR